MNSEIIWKECDVKLNDLKEYKDNPRRMSKAAYQRLVESLKEHGYNNRMLVNQDNTIIGGHCRKRALKEIGYKPSDNVKVLKPNRQLSDKEFKRLNVRDNVEFGEFDIDMLSVEFEIEELKDIGVPDFYFGFYEKDEKIKEETEPKELELTYSIKVTFENEKDMVEVYKDLSEKGYNCKVV